MPADPKLVETLFNRALEFPSADRPAFLAAGCGGDPELRGRVERLLAAHAELGEPATADVSVAPPTATFGSGAGEPTADFPGKDEHIGAILGGKYKLIEEIGEGGMGSVYMAQQTEPVKRAVAVKVIKAGMDSKAVLARFEAERQALAMMDHPNIARVLDAGTTEAGRPYFVMELVKGVSITQYCDERKLTPRQRLELFVPVCNAIQHAHQKGIIHRDIKPSNVLVAMYDDRPVPKVIDFGVAKAAGSTLTDKTLMTGFGAVVGTPEYMSPEQASLNNLDIDTRSDVYSLGVLLYELLTGHTPVDRKSLGKAALLEILRIVREVEAPRPSAKLSTSDARASISANRGSDPAKLSKLMKGELDWVLLKALEKDRTRRYDTANGLARDIQRYLADEVVEARPSSTGYRVRKFVRRHKGRVAATTAFLVLLVAAVAVSSWLAVQAKRAETDADAKRREAQDREADARMAEAEANKARWETLEEKAKSDISSLGLQIDLDLIETRTDPRVGLLRLAQPRRDRSRGFQVRAVDSDTGEVLTGLMETSYANRPDWRPLREFLTVAVLAKGQEFAPLVRPITHDGQRVVEIKFSEDAKTLLTRGHDDTARLWEAGTWKPLAVLRQGQERVQNCGYSTDCRTIFTDDESGVVRLWDSAGKYVAETRPRPHVVEKAVKPADLTTIDTIYWQSSFAVPDGLRVIGRDRLITLSSVHEFVPNGNPGEEATYLAGPVELWDTTTGKCLARLDRADKPMLIARCRFSDDGQYILALARERGKPVHALVFAAADGREVARLEAPAGEEVRSVCLSPSSRTVAVVTGVPNAITAETTVRVWEGGKWPPDGGPRTCVLRGRGGDLLGLWDEGYCCLGEYTFEQTKASLYRLDRRDPVCSSWWFSPDPAGGGRLLASDGRLFDLGSGAVLRPLTGQRYHPELTRLAYDGRLLAAADPEAFREVVIDLRAQKAVPLSTVCRDRVHLSGLGIVTAGRMGGNLAVIPSRPAELDIPPQSLELWAQVAVRGELGPDGAFVPWNEETWQKKRLELAAVKPPSPTFPFPGFLASDSLHWLRAEYADAKDGDKPRLVAELLRRAEASGDKIEAVRWRAETERLSPHVAPPPREVKR